MMPFNVSGCGDNVARQKTLMKESACKVKNLFNFCYTTTSKECFLPNNIKCIIFFSYKDGECKFFHKEFHNSVDNYQFNKKMSQLEVSIRSILLSSDKNDLFYVESTKEDDFENVNCTYFSDYENDNSLKTAFNLDLS